MEENEKKEEKSGRKKAVKNFAIVFIVALLLLTFFSNTIMNHSLPEVSTTTVSSGSVSQKVRCQGDVQTAKDVEITVSGERVVKEVFVESGDEVKKGDMIVSFNEEENPELKKAEEELKDMERTHEKNLLKMGVDYTDDYLEIEKAKETVAEAEEALKEARASEAEGNNTKDQIASLTERIKQKKEVVAELSNRFETEAEAVEYQDTLEEIQKLEDQAEELQGKMDEAQKIIDDSTAEIEKILNDLGLRGIDPDDPANYADPDVIKLGELREKLNESSTVLAEASNEKIDIEENQIPFKKESIASVMELADSLASEKAAVDLLEAELTELTSAPAAETTTVKGAEKTLKEAQDSLEAKQRALVKKQEEDALQQQKDDIDMKKEIEALEEKRKEVQKLKDHDDTVCIVAPNDGIITNISLKEGDKVSSENPIATIQLAESGYEVVATIPKADGKLIRVGDEAALENVWSDAHAEVKSIKPDPNDPNKNVVVKFEVKGEDINVGQTIQFAVGEKSQKYDTVVPNNAVKEDTGGNFVLVVKVKSTPLGNRYTIKKVEVTKLASDTTKCAISGDVSEYDNVVTNSSKRLDNGQQVRLSEKQ